MLRSPLRTCADMMLSPCIGSRIVRCVQISVPSRHCPQALTSFADWAASAPLVRFLWARPCPCCPIVVTKVEQASQMAEIESFTARTWVCRVFGRSSSLQHGAQVLLLFRLPGSASPRAGLCACQGCRPLLDRSRPAATAFPALVSYSLASRRGP